MKAFSVVLVVFGVSSGFAAPAARVGLLGLTLGRQGLASAGIGIGSAATNMATGLASNALGALGGVPILSPFAKIGQAAVETGNNFAQMGMGIGKMAVNGFSGLGGASRQQLAAQQLSGQLAAQQQLAAQLGAQQQLAAQFGAQQQLAAQFGAQQQQLASQLAAQQQISQASAQLQGVQQGGSVQQPASNIRQTESFQDILGSPELDSWWNPSPPQPIYIG